MSKEMFEIFLRQPEYGYKVFYKMDNRELCHAFYYSKQEYKDYLYSLFSERIGEELKADFEFFEPPSQKEVVQAQELMVSILRNVLEYELENLVSHIRDKIYILTNDMKHLQEIFNKKYWTNLVEHTDDFFMVTELIGRGRRELSNIDCLQNKIFEIDKTLELSKYSEDFTERE